MKSVLMMALGFLSLQCLGQSSNKINFAKGQKLDVIAEIKAVVSQEVMGQPMDVNINSTIRRLYDIEEVKGGTATIEHKIKRVQITIDAMGQSQSFDSEKEEDMKNDMGKSIEKNIKNKYTLTVNSQGKIESVKADDDNTNKPASQGEDMMGNMMAQFAEGLEVPKIGDLFPLQVKSKGALTKGQSWSDSLSGAEVGQVIYTIENVTASDILISFSSQSTAKRKQEVGNGMTMDVSLKNMLTGKITLDKKTGLIKQKSSEGSGAGTMEIMGQSIPMKTKLSSTMTVGPF